MKRRNFLKYIKSSTIFGLTLPLTGFKSSSNNLKKITILHTNDVHSHIDPFPGNDPINPNSGGVIARSNLINSIKKGNPNTLVLDAGDVFQGTPYFNFFEGEVELKLMSKMGYNASTLGNHEFDNGIEKLAKSLKHANFSFLNSNYTFDTYIVGSTNKFAHAAALAVAENPGKVYNPLFLYANSGLGKTHLMHAAGNHIAENTNKRVLYVTS